MMFLTALGFALLSSYRAVCVNSWKPRYGPSIKSKMMTTPWLVFSMMQSIDRSLYDGWPCNATWKVPDSKQK
ncbi:uncharacterized protein EDB91DRAFT_1154789 [Suillus paluster]|uniref:uncharacterized protein n=1 Tax=Suillus paluster TaxID=48578 RepID=UPI001B882226|nr:uncharacterized protein EDB91DRAFT_1154789 [Suillus paluster]KAG1731174.1 hypothetical protein EDB91DRAFT_1154789 [Suillus paluster]